MSLWDWVLAAYGRPDAPETCLKLQDEFGQNTSLLLWAAWARTTDAALLAAAVRTARDWDEAVLVPLRDVRRALKAPAPPVDDVAREGLREDVKAAELRAERVLVETLEVLARGIRGQASPVDSVTAASRAWGKPAPDAALASLVAALGAGVA